MVWRAERQDLRSETRGKAARPFAQDKTSERGARADDDDSCLQTIKTAESNELRRYCLRLVGELCRSCGDEAVASADGCHLQMKGGVFGVAALVEERLIGLFGREDGYEHITLVVLAKVTTYAALSVVNCLHFEPP